MSTNISALGTSIWNTYGGNSANVTPYSVAAVASGVCICAALLVSSIASRKDVSGVPQSKGIPFIGEWAFFSRRHRFLEDGLRRLGKIFGFNILHHKVYAVSGEEARKVFFGSKDLSPNDGYAILFGGAPRINEIKLEREYDDGDMTWFGKRLLNVLKRERLAIMIPSLINDIDLAMTRWGNKGKFNSFDDIYEMVFQLTIRAGSCREIADDPAAVKRLTELYWLVERGSTATSILLPWFPSRARKQKNDATVELYMILKKHIDDRKETGRAEMDAMQVLLDMGDGVNDIVQFILGVLFAGILNTGIMASWMLLFLHASPIWKAKAIAEVKSFISKYASPSSTSTDLASQLSAIPPEVWDDEMPILDLCLRETIRVVMTGAALRRVMTDDVVVDGVKVERGSFLAFLMSSTHADPEMYDAPEKWDPSRYERGDDKKQHWGYIGWGVGRHPCLGMRFAKLEVKIILALFLTRYNFSLVDASDKPVKVLPEPYRDNLYQVPPSRPVFVQYERKDKL